MVSSCLMLGCTSSTSTKGLSFHRFPKDPKLKSLWVAATRRHKWEPTKWSRICCGNFSPNNYKNNKLLAGSVPERGIEVTHKASPHQGDKLLSGSVPNPKPGIEVIHKASPLQGEEIQVQGVQLMDRQENYVEKASHNHPQPLLILTSQIVINRSLLIHFMYMPNVFFQILILSCCKRTLITHTCFLVFSLFVFVFWFPLIDAL